jgi:hypothetical protein
MTEQPEHNPGEHAPAAATYELLTVLGAATGVEVALLRGSQMPAAPIGQKWRRRRDTVQWLRRPGALPLDPDGVPPPA